MKNMLNKIVAICTIFSFVFVHVNTFAGDPTKAEIYITATIYQGAGTLPYQDGWPVESQSSISNPLNIMDLDGDGTTEVLLNSGDMIHIWQYDGSDFAGWPQIIAQDAYNTSSPVIRDVDLTVNPGILASYHDGSGKSNVAGFYSDGGKMTDWQDIADSISKSICLGDLTGDGVDEVISVSENDKSNIYAREQDGEQAPGWPVNTGEEERDFTDGVAVGDLDGDGLNEIVACSKGGYAGIYVFRDDGSVMTGWPQALSGIGYSKGAPILGDVDKDGDLEIIFCSEVTPSVNKIYIFHHDGALPTGWPVILEDDLEFSPVMGDVNGDGETEIVVGTKENKVYVFDKDAGLLTGWPVETDEPITSSPVLGDIDGDAFSDILICTEKKAFAWQGSGSLVTGWPITTAEPQDGYLKSPALCDLDGDGDIEFLAYSTIGKVYAWDLSGAYSEDNIEWGKYQYDCKHSGLYKPDLVLSPLPPTDLTIYIGSWDLLDLHWQDNSDDEDGFKIERGTDGILFTELPAEAGVDETVYNDSGLDKDTTYYYRIRAYNAYGDSEYSNTVSARPSDRPIIESITPAIAAPGATIEIYGRNFGLRNSIRCKVYFYGEGYSKGVRKDIIEWKEDYIKCIVPSLPVGKQRVKIMTQAGRGATNTFRVYRPVINCISPVLTGAGEEVTIYGSYFGARTKYSKVRLYGDGECVDAEIVSWQDGEIVFEVSLLSEAYDSYEIKVRTGAGWSNGTNCVYSK